MMKNLYPEYRKKNAAECLELWNDALIYIDTNVLIDLYSYSDDTTNSFLDLIGSLKEKIWIPKRVAFEYTRKRLTIISQQKNPYEDLVKDIDKIEKSLDSKIDPFLSTDLHKKTKGIFEKIRVEAKESIKNKLNIIDEDFIYKKFCDYFDGKVLNGFNDEELKEIYIEGADRYTKKIPPGYKDITKEGNDKYGDLIIWKEIIEKAKETKLPVIFVTGELKESWVYEIGGQKIGVCPELSKEMRDNAGVEVLIYSSSSFLKYGQEFLKKDIDNNAIEEIQERNIRALKFNIFDSSKIRQEIGLIKNEIDVINNKIELYQKKLENLNPESHEYTSYYYLIETYKKKLEINEKKMEELREKLFIKINRKRNWEIVDRNDMELPEAEIDDIQGD